MYHNHNNGNEIELVSSFTVTAQVKFVQLSENGIRAYVKTGEPMDKAGSYDMQGIGGQMIECVEGDFLSVWGFQCSGLIESWQLYSRSY